MNAARLYLGLALCLLAGSPRSQATEPAAVSHLEDFASDPSSRGWTIFGDDELFQWDSSADSLAMTWDSSHANSYFELPLGTVLTRRDDFRADLDLEFHDIAVGVGPEKVGTFQIAFGFLNRLNAHSPKFIRGTANDSPNLVEFNYFPGEGRVDSTVWPAIFSTHSMLNYRGFIDFNLFDLPIQTPLQISLTYTASNETASITITSNGVLVGPVTSTKLIEEFTDFQVDTFALISYSDEGQPPTDYVGSVLAHATIHRILVTTPPPPIVGMQGRRELTGWEVSFQSLTHWSYRLQASAQLREWESVGEATEGNGASLSLRDAFSPEAPSRFYRVVAERR